MIKVQLVDRLTGLGWISDRFFSKFAPLRDNSNVLATTDFVGAHGRFQSATRTTAGTTAVVTPITSGSIMLTDLISSGEKQASSVLTVQFTDGSNTAVIFAASQVDAPPNFAIPFRGRFQGWKDARIDMITSGAGDATVTLGFVQFPTGLGFAEWNAAR